MLKFTKRSASALFLLLGIVLTVCSTIGADEPENKKKSTTKGPNRSYVRIERDENKTPLVEAAN